LEQAVAKIIETERKACALIEEIQNEKNQLNNSVEEEVKELKEKYDARTENRIEIVLKDENEILQKALEEIEEQKQEKLDQMNKLFEENFEKWTETIFERIVK